MNREELDPEVDAEGFERHPAFALIGASRTTIGPTGIPLFDSDVLHRHTVRVRIKAATRHRDLHRDWIHGGPEYIEVELSEAQWASFVSSMNTGDGVPCTLRYVDGAPVPEFPYEPRLAQTMAETRDAANRAYEKIVEAFAVYQRTLTEKAPAKERAAALGALRAAIDNAVPNVVFTGKQLIEQTENVVQKARADVEAFVVAKAAQLGLTPSDVMGLDGSFPALALEAAADD